MLNKTKKLGCTYPHSATLEWIKELNPQPKNVIDLGSGIDMPFKKIIERNGIRFFSTCPLSIYGDYKDLDFNKQKLPFKNKQFDLVICTHVLEHLFEPFKVMKEIERIAKRNIIIALPNQYTIDERILFLFGKNLQGFNGNYDYWGHHTIWSIKAIDEFIKKSSFRISKKKYFCCCHGSRLLPNIFAEFLAGLYPRMFAKQVWYLLERTA